MGADQVTQQIPKIGEDVTALMGVPAKPSPAAPQTIFKTDTLELTAQPKPSPPVPAVGDDVTDLMGESPAEPTFKTEVRASDGVEGKGFAKELWDLINPMGIVEAAKNPLGSAKALITANPQFLEEAKAAAASGDYLTALRKFLSYGTMGMGNVLDRQSELLEQGDYGSAAGSMTGLAAGTIAPPVVGRVVRGVARGPLRNPNADVRDAVKFGEQEGVPIDAATATGSPVVSRTQQMAGANLGGARRAEAFQTAQGSALERTMQRLTDRSHPSAVTTEQAGQGVVGALEGRATQQARLADDAYGRLRAFEEQAVPTTVQQPVTGRVAGGGTVQTTQPQQIKLAVDLTSTKAAMRPIYELLTRERELVGVLQGGKATALTALDRLMNAPDFAPLSVADAALGDLKAVARGARIPALRTQGQGIAAAAVRELDAAVRKAATDAGPDVLAALDEGRAATIAKHATADVLDRLTRGTNDEPVRVAGRLTAPNDSAVALLRELNAIAPDQLPKVGRSVLEGLLEKQTSTGVFGKGADGLFSAWQRLGPQTKAMLFRDRGLVRDLDNFFLLAKKIGENPNPSGTALTRSATQWLQMAPNWAVAKLLYSPRAVKFLTEGLRIPAANRAGQAAWMAELAAVAQESGVTLSPAGAVADRDEAKK